jgi:branched-chain amino acid aminotransferase
MKVIFRPDENYKRFNNSARMAMPEVPETIFMDG